MHVEQVQIYIQYRENACMWTGSPIGVAAQLGGPPLFAAHSIATTLVATSRAVKWGACPIVVEMRSWKPNPGVQSVFCG